MRFDITKGRPTAAPLKILFCYASECKCRFKKWHITFFPAACIRRNVEIAQRVTTHTIL